MNYVDRVLHHHRSANISKFKLSCDEACDDSRVISCISTVAARNRLEELDLSVSMKQPHVIPESIYSCRSLTKLTLFARTGLKLPTTFSLPNLKSLGLTCMTFTDERLTEKFFSSFPVLEELTLDHCKWVNHNTLSISVPSLKRLSMCWVGFGENGFLCDCAIKICAPTLESFICSAFILPKDFILCGLSSLIYAEFNCGKYGDVRTKEERCRSACNLLNGLFNAKVLEIPADVVNVLPDQEVEIHLPMFHNLTQLTLSRFCSNFGILGLLKLMPNLETLAFDRAYGNGEDELILDAVPHCLLSSLKKVQVEEYKGWKGESHLIEFLLKNALVLKRMAITYGAMMTRDPTERMEDKERILMIPKGSMSCAVEFFSYSGNKR